MMPGQHLLENTLDEREAWVMCKEIVDKFSMSQPGDLKLTFVFSLGPLPTDYKADQDEYEVTGRARRIPVTVWKERTSLGSSALRRRWELRFGLEKGSARIIALKGDSPALACTSLFSETDARRASHVRHNWNPQDDLTPLLAF
jgi:hypothetical protein